MKSLISLIAIVTIVNAAQLFIPNGPQIKLNPDSYIVVLKNSTVATGVRSRHFDILTANKIAPKYTYDMHDFVGYAAKISNKTVLSMIMEDKNVDYVEQDHFVYASQQQVQTNAPWHLERICVHDFADMDGNYHYPISAGAGVTAYIVDTGVRCSHDEFEVSDDDTKSRCVFGYDATGEGKFDGNGHGTHVASTVAGLTYGVAKAASIVAVKVLESDGSGTNAGVIAGVNYVVQQYQSTRKPSLANMSLGGGKSTALDSAVAKAIASGVQFAIAAGNDDSNACNYSPADVSVAVTVGATELGVSEDARSYFSNYGSCVDVFAPGSDITAAWMTSDTATATISGTSMATPVVCGVMALALSADPSLTPAQLHTIVKTQSTDGVINLACGSVSACKQSPNLMIFSLMNA